MIIDGTHPDARNIKVYDKEGNIMPGIISVDTDTMTGLKFVGTDHLTGDIRTVEVDVYKIKGPNIFYKRNRSFRVLNTDRR